MLNMHRGAEFSESFVEEGGAVVGNIASPEILLRSTEITHEVISIGGWHSVHEPADCKGRYFDQKKERKLSSGKSKRKEASSSWCSGDQGGGGQGGKRQ